MSPRHTWLVLALVGLQGCAQLAGIEEIKPLSSKAKQEPEGGSDQGGSDQGGSDQGGSDQGGSGGAAGKATGGKSQGGAANTGATGGTGGSSPGGKGGAAGEPVLCAEGGPSYTGAKACEDCQNATSSICCAEELAACAQVSDCSALTTCVKICADSSCYDGCFGKHTKGYDAYAAMLKCVVGDGVKLVGACGLACQGAGGSGGAGGSAGSGSAGAGGASGAGTGGASGKCNDGGPGFTGANACTDCVYQADAAGGCCAPKVDACEEAPSCTALEACYNSCQGNQTCFDKCAKDNPAGYKVYEGLLDCLYGAGGGFGACGKACQ